jgi:hypothetical protein
MASNVIEILQDNINYLPELAGQIRTQLDENNSRLSNTHALVRPWNDPGNVTLFSSVINLGLGRRAERIELTSSGISLIFSLTAITTSYDLIGSS